MLLSSPEAVTKISICTSNYWRKFKQQTHDLKKKTPTYEFQVIEQWSQHGEYCQKIASAILVSITVKVYNYIPRITVGKIHEASGSLNFLLNTIHLKYCVKVRITTLLEELRSIGIFSENNQYENRHSYIIRRTIGGTSNIII